MAKTGLGKGLSALIPMASPLLEDEEAVTEIAVSTIMPNPFQPRRVFDEEKLRELAASIKEHGVVQPIVVRELSEGKHELVVGERRWRACQLLGWEKMPAVIKEYTNEQIMEIALVENIQRQDLNPLEEARAYKKLLTEFNYTQEQVAQKVSKSRSFIANMVRILNLPEPILEQVATGELTVGHVRPLLTVESNEQQINAAAEMLYKKMTVREAESFVKEIGEGGKKKKAVGKKQRVKLSPELVDIEAQLRERCGTKVSIKPRGNKGKIEIEYYGLDDLNRVLSIFFPK
ncbi:MAG: ParB/RepB/Spo0J family partition protein [Clostridia bacterium]|nr:ParB/RepB/Spo0J family partition protein [Clostridia bacterium]